MRARFIAALAAFAVAGTASAQDAGQIARVEAGLKACPGCNLFQADFSYWDMPGRDFSGARLRQATLTAGIFDDTNFVGADLSILDGAAARFSSARFRDADLSRANFVGAYLGYADFAGADLTDADLSGAELEGAKNLTQSQLDAACGDSSTQLPSPLTIRDCGSPF